MGNQATKQHQANGGKPKKFVHWKSAERPSPPGKPLLIPPLPDQQPDIVTLKWERPKSDGGSPILGYVIEHRRMGSSNWLRATPILVTKTEVSISGLEPGWRYQFRTIAENVVGRSEPSDLSDPLTVTLQRAISAPLFTAELIDTIVVENEKVEIKVGVFGQPPPDINWFKDGFEIYSSRRTKIVNDNDSSTLIIHQVALTDEGEIKCTATNRAGHVSTRAKLKVEAPPKIRLPRQYEDGIIAEADEVLRLKVGLAGQPPPAVFWNHDGEIIKNGGRFEIITTDKNSSLKIDNIKRTDRGEYGIRAVNKRGEDVASFLVTVTARPNPPGKIKLEMSFGRSATLSWVAPDDDGGCKIGNYIVEYFRIGWNVWLKASTTRQLTTTLHDLIEGSEYKFRVKAENPYGVSDPSTESDILFIPDPKRGIMKPEVREQQNLAETIPPIPPKRRTLSPLRNLLGAEKDGSDRDASPSRKPPSPSAINVRLIPQIYESEDLHREMSYGTPDAVLVPKDSKKSPTKNGHVSSQVNKDETINQSTDTNMKTDNKLGINQKIQQFFQKSPSPMRRKSAPEVAHEKSNYLTPDFKPKEDEVVREKSPSPKKRVSIVDDKSPKLSERKTSVVSENKSPVSLQEKDSSSIEKEINVKDNKDPLTTEKSPNLERRGSFKAVKEKVQQFFRRSPSPSRADQPSEPESDQVLLNKKSISLQRSEEPVPRQSTFRKSPSPMREIVNTQNRPLMGKPEEYTSTNNNVQSTGVKPLAPNPKIEVSAPRPDYLRVMSDSEKHDDGYTSSELMLVFYPNKKSKENKKQESFDLELEECLAPPPLSLSAPDLGSDQAYMQIPPLRRSVSSTELLYERAMARFYEAVELEEAERVKKRKPSEDYQGQELQPRIRKRLGSFTETERLSFERRSSMRRRLSEEIQLGLHAPKTDLRDNLTEFKKQPSPVVLKPSPPPLEKEISEDLSEDENQMGDSLEYDEDYTESTASSEDSIEKFKIELMARTKSPSGELETYHPRRMEEGTFSPYRSPTPDQSSVVLTRPVPLPSPDFIPKPILKRSSVENVVKEEEKLSEKVQEEKLTEKVQEEKLPEKVQEEKLPEKVQKEKLEILNETKVVDTIPKSIETKQDTKGKGLMSFFRRDKFSHSENENKNIDDALEKKRKDIEMKRKAAEEAEKARLEKSKSTEEEAKVVAEYYNNIVRELGNTRKSTVPLYMRGDELRKAEEKAEQEEQQMRLKIEGMNVEMERTLAKPRLSIIERLQSAHVQDRSKSAVDKPGILLTPEITSNSPPGLKMVNTPPSPEDESIRGRQPKKVKKIIIKKRTLSGTRSRDNSSSRPPLSPQTTTSTVVTSSAGETTQSAVQRRAASKTRNRSESKSPGALNRRPLTKEHEQLLKQKLEPLYVASLQKSLENEGLTIEGTNLSKNPSEEILEIAEEQVRSTMSYVTDVGLFLVACWVYIFKDARLVLPILALMLYRQIGEAIKNRIPNWMKRKKMCI